MKNAVENECGRAGREERAAFLHFHLPPQAVALRNLSGLGFSSAAMVGTSSLRSGELESGRHSFFADSLDLVLRGPTAS